ncbi:MAG: PSD1 and planctomycete cytochrome C domain-containing protein, partial [Planctomycetia bacterium]
SHAAPPAPDFSRDVSPILAEYCLACHGPDAAGREAGLRLDDRESATATLESGAVAIVPGRPDTSAVIERIESDDPDTVMPPPDSGKRLPAAAREQLRAWIEAGANYESHWAFRQPQRPPVPAVEDAAWVRSPIDAFVLHQLEQADMRPAPEAPQHTLLRRLSLDLTGLPPTVEELDAFLADDSPQAYERAVDRLLASPHCAEKLAMEWLDLARFGDSSGYQDDGDRPNHPYRDAVIEAFHANMPFDQFTIESLAGDLLPDATLMQKVRSGFNRLHRYNEEGGSDPEEFRVVYAIDRTNTTAATWMGVTFGCTQCHDHKYDPFSQQEYYQLLAFFNSLRGEVPVGKQASPPFVTVYAEQDRRRLDEIDREIAAAEEARAREIAPAVARFEQWLADPLAAPALHPDAVGGAVARGPHRSYFADTALAAGLSFDTPLHARGSLVVVKAEDSDTEVGHFAHSASETTLPGVGIAIAEGPRVFAHFAATDGSVLHGPAIAAKYGAAYEWSYAYDPATGKVAVELRSGKDTSGKDQVVGRSEVAVPAEHRRAAVALDAFGISARGVQGRAGPMVLVVDDLEYTAAPASSPRREDFKADPGWQGLDNLADGHDFGLRFGRLVRAGVSAAVERLRGPGAIALEPAQLAAIRDIYVERAVPESADGIEKMKALRGQRAEIAGRGARALVWEEDHPRPTHLLKRGDFLQPGERVERGVPAVFPPLTADAPRDRLALARWLLQDDHPLTARVAVNRFWKLVFGAGLVRTPEDFGTRGELPTHPELLDWLAVEFRAPSDGGRAWDIKRLLKLLVTSSTYRQSSAVPRAVRDRDPDNRLLGRGSRYRLPAEEIRDAALVSSGLLARTVGGRSVYPYQPAHLYADKEDDPGELLWPTEKGPDLYRRGLYTFIRRTIPYPVFQTFDMAGRGECTIARPRTNTPLQALVTLNNPTFVEAARVIAEQVVGMEGSDDARLDEVCRRILSRPGSAEERKLLMRLLHDERERFRAHPTDADLLATQGAAAPRAGLDRVAVAAWATVASAVINTDEAITRE